MENLIEMLKEWAANPYLQAAGIVVASIIAAKIVDWIVCGAVGRWTKKTKTSVDDQFVTILHSPLFVSVRLLGLGIATHRLELPEKPTQVTLHLLETIALVVWFIFTLRFSRLMFSVLSYHQDRFDLIEARTLPVFNNTSLMILVGASAYGFCLIWEIPVHAWLASAGIIGLALSFAAKDSLANLFAGVFILADVPYKVGDFVVLDTGERGRITQIGLRSTRMLTRDDVEVTIPNSVMGNSKIVNESGGPHTKERVRVKVSVAYGSDIDVVRETLIEIAIEHPGIATIPEPRVRFRHFGESGLEIELLGWIDEPVLRGRTLDALNTAVYKRFLADGIEIPYAKRDVYVREMPAKNNE